MGLLLETRSLTQMTGCGPLPFRYFALGGKHRHGRSGIEIQIHNTVAPRIYTRQEKPESTSKILRHKFSKSGITHCFDIACIAFRIKYYVIIVNIRIRRTVRITHAKKTSRLRATIWVKLSNSGEAYISINWTLLLAFEMKCYYSRYSNS